MNNMKVGITTHYYKSNNYGGNLQAYALCKVLQKNGVNAEQICFANLKGKRSIKSRVKQEGIFRFAKNCVKHILKNVKLKTKKQKLISKQLNIRNQNILKFNNNIPHSQNVYNRQSIDNANKDYDLFITGSDQVWHPSAINYAYTLEFVKEKTKMSYAASISKSTIDDKQKEFFKTFLKDYKRVSVREQNAVSLLSDLSPVSVEWVLDPTLLLSRQEWCDIIEECDIREKFIFCYFLGNDKRERKRAKEFAVKKGLKVVDIPHLHGFYEKADKNFADINVTTASIGQFIWLIKNADYVFTDSFHATVFSLIFKKQFFVFEREGFKGMGERITSLLSLFDLCERFVKEESSKNLIYINNLMDIDFSKEFFKFNEKKNYSLEFLYEGLKGE